MKRLHSAFLFALAPAIAIVLVAPNASATKLRRPFAEEKSFNYGFDNKAGSGCTDHQCGTRCYDGHTGTDYAISIGTDVLAPADGKVIATNNGCANYGGLGNTCGGSCGNYVKLQLADGNKVLFCHMQLNSLQVSNGNNVKCGQVLGKSASSGNSSGPHLHLAWRNSSEVGMNPYVGSCSSTSVSAWTDQGSYTGATGTQCDCVGQVEICNGIDDNCNGQIDEGDVCEQEALLRGQSWMAPARTTDIDGDGRADVCGRGMAGIWCHASKGTSWAAKGPTLGLSDADGWNDPTNWGTFRMGDIDGDGRADLCARGNDGMICWKSNGTSLATAVNGPPWSNANGWKGFAYHSTIRLLDIDGDGKDDLCARAGKGISCYKSTGNGFGEVIDGPAWSDASGMASAKYYGTLRTGDVNGDGKEDLCMRTKDGMECWLSNGNGFPTRVEGPAWSDASGWGAMQYWTTIRLADVNGDGRADLCARSSAGIRCHFSLGNSFGPEVGVASLTDATGWANPEYYLTLRVGDVDGDGAQDLCIRAAAGILCYRWNGTSFESFDGPAWSNADGWNQPKFYHTIQLGDMNGDGKADLCGRHTAGWRCHPSTGKGFGAAIPLDEFSDAGGWSAERYYGTIQFGGPWCGVQGVLCEDPEPDCKDGVGPGCPTGGSGGAGGGSGAGGTGGQANNGGTGGIEEADSGTEDDAGTDAGPGTSRGGSGQNAGWDYDMQDSGCACHVGGRFGYVGVAWVLVAGLGVGVLRRRRTDKTT